ncbi:uncharacterized protein LOC141901024 isoform X2 [Tubulanus polymorphus]
MISEMKRRNWKSAWTGIKVTHSDWHWEQDGEFIAAQGCFEDNIRTKGHDLPHPTLIENGSLTPIVCRNACSNLSSSMKYAGVQAGNQCWCGENHLNSYSTIPCNTPCEGDPTLTCGNTNRRNYIYRIKGGFSSWEPEMINRGPTEPMCALLSAPSFNWKERRCWSTAKFICVLPFSQECDYNVHENHCLYVSEDEKSWFKSRETCHSLGGHLLTIKSQDKQEIMVKFLKFEQRKTSDYWIGASNFNWKTWNGSQVRYTGPWSTNSWFMEHGDEKCVQMTFDRANDELVWNVVSCKADSHYICKRVLTRRLREKPVPIVPAALSATSSTVAPPRLIFVLIMILSSTDIVIKA